MNLMVINVFNYSRFKRCSIYLITNYEMAKKRKKMTGDVTLHI